MAKSAPEIGFPANVALHPTFLWPVRLAAKRRRGPLPRGVVLIKRASRLRIGVLAEVVGSADRPENDGIRVLITDFDARNRHCWLTKSLGRAIRCSDDTLDREVWFKPEQLRRVWVGLSINERIQLRMRRVS